MWSALGGHRPTSCAKLMFVIASCMMDKVASIGQVTHFVDPGFEASNCSLPQMQRLKEETELHNPSVIFANVSLSEDCKTNPRHENLIEYISEQEAN